MLPLLEKKYANVLEQVSEVQLKGHAYYLDRLQQERSRPETSMTGGVFLQIIEGMQQSIREVKGNYRLLSRQVASKDQEIESLQKRVESLVSGQEELLASLQPNESLME